MTDPAANLRAQVAKRIAARMRARGLSDAAAAALCWPLLYPPDNDVKAARGHQRMLALRRGTKVGWSACDLVGLERGLGLTPSELFRSE